jgi:hypothetical protein
MRSGSDYDPSMPEVRPSANPGMPSTVLAYHAEDEIARAVAIGEVVVGVVLVVIGLALLRRLEGAPTAGRNVRARRAGVVVAGGIGAYALNRAIPYGDDPGNALVALGLSLLLLMVIVGVTGPVLAIFGLEGVRFDGERRLAVLVFVASLVLPGIFVANFVACAVTDACFH